jgi:two-component system sensor histidine kinase CpxA
LNVALELAREETPDAATALDRAELESSRLNALIGELLSLSSMEALQSVQNRSMISLADLVACNHARSDFRSRGARM